MLISLFGSFIFLGQKISIDWGLKTQPTTYLYIWLDIFVPTEQLLSQNHVYVIFRPPPFKLIQKIQ